ncbi:MAG: hypothetical protein JW384_00043 [Nitrosomonadaceae bacterium]|nr:hypothetical protein [Nitrosomonadaceae bacterium]
MAAFAKQRLAALAVFTLAELIVPTASAQDSSNNYPARPITLVFNSSGTTSSDTELRLYQNALKGITNATFVFDYKGGASGAVGAVYVARQRPDGYTYLATASTILSVPLLTKDIGYDVFRDFEPVTMMSKKNFMVLVHPDAPYRTIKEYVDHARANPGKLNWSTSGDGSSTHLPGLLLHSMTQTNVTFIGYKNANDKLLDLMAGRVQVSVGTILASMGYIKAGKMRAIAVTDSERSKLLPDLPTVAQSGIPELSDYEYATWLGVFAPAKTPATVLARFTGWLQQASKDPLVIKALDAADTVQVISPPEQFKQFLGKEFSRLDKAVKASGISPQ